MEKLIEELFVKDPKVKHIKEIQELLEKDPLLDTSNLQYDLNRAEFLEHYAGNFWGYKDKRKENLSILLDNKTYFKKFVTLELFPDTQLSTIRSCFRDEELKAKVEAQILEFRRYIFHEEGKEFFVLKKWFIGKKIECILFNMGRPLTKNELVQILYKNKYRVQNIEKEMTAEIKTIVFNNGKYFHRDVMKMLD